MKKTALFAAMALHMAAFTAKASAVSVWERRDEPTIKSVADALDKIATAFDQYKKTNDERIEAVKSGKGTAELDAKLARMDEHINSLGEVKTKLEKMETKLSRPGAMGGSGEQRESAETVEYKHAFLDWMRAPADGDRQQRAAAAQKPR